MRSADFLALATGALRGHRLRTALSLTGVAIGVAAVILLTSLGEGARTYVTREFTSLGSNLLIVFPGKTETTGMAPVFGGAPHDLTLDDVDAIRRRLPYIVAAAPLSIGRATIRFGSRSREVVIAGTTPEYHRIRRLEMRMGTPLPERGAEADRAVCLIGPTIQSELFPDMNPLGQTLRVGDERFRVIGVTVPRGGTSLGSDVDDMVTVPVRRHMRMFNTTTLFRVLIEG